ncbi:hypothetical protein PR048_016560 [Dryococelus australis]|uniref:Uncharacterized protein n=1 Tax=Dryococelus australis TaxID=614101 RepID=A0ABQ9HK56_9NEOP|nr:hypothetical protein PR048_016560 [Dryococelus australis]
MFPPHLKDRKCKSFFGNMYSLSRGKINEIIQNKCASASSIRPNTGSGMNEPYNKTDTEKKKALTHIKSFLAYESHYSRNGTQKTYLRRGLSENKMYDLYCEKEQHRLMCESVYRVKDNDKQKSKIESEHKVIVYNMQHQILKPT